MSHQVRPVRAAREYLRTVLGFDPGSAMPNSGYGGMFLDALRLGRVSGSFRYVDDGGGVLRLRLSDRQVCHFRDDWAAAIVLASLLADHPRAGQQDRTELLACAATLMAQGEATVVDT